MRASWLIRPSWAALAALLFASICATGCVPLPPPTTTPQAATSISVPPTAEPAPPTATMVPRAPPTPPAVLATPELRPSGSVVQEQLFDSPALGQSMTYLIYLPSGYPRLGKRYPAVYMLHGVAGDSTEWPSIGVPEAADRLIDSGEIQPMLFVFPYGDAGFYVNNANGGLRWEDHLVQDVVASVDSHYRTLATPASRAVAGLSMGGDGALQLIFRHPEVFGVAAAHSPSSRLLFEHATQNVYGSREFFRDRNPFWIAQEAHVPEDLKIWIDVGDEDPWRWNARSIHGALTARGIRHEFHLLPGKHEGEYWIAHLEKYLRFYDRALAGP